MRNKKATVDFMAGLRTLEQDAVQRRPRPAPAAADRPGVGEGPRVGEGPHPGAGTRPGSRHGKVAITQWVDPVVRKQLAQLGLDHDKTQAELAAEALNLLFEKYGKSPIATG
jgi:hypothetical protein